MTILDETYKADITGREGFWLWVMRKNASDKRREIRHTWNIGKLSIQYHWRSSKNSWGRFGGGWNWKFGFQAGGKTLILELLVFSLRFSYAD